MKTTLHSLANFLFCLLLLVFMDVKVKAQIPNWDMETWTTHASDVPTPWLTFGQNSKVSPGASGQYAIRLQGDNDKGPGAVLYGNPNGSNFSGGTPFTARPDSMVAYFKYEIDAGDSAWVIVSLKKNGTDISNDLYLYTGSYTANFKRMAFKIHYTSSVNPDTIFIGFTSTIPDVPNGGQVNTHSYVILDDVSFTGTTQNVPNPDFESWVTQTMYTPDGWQTDNRNEVSNVERSGTSYTGNYAMKLRTVIDPNGDTMSGYTQTKRPGNSNSQWGPAFAVNSKPISFKGFYKYFPENGDTCRISINFFKASQQVGQADFSNSATVNTYTPFSMDINYFNLPTGNPDSATISISTFVMNQNTQSPRGQSTLYIDNLSFDNFIHSGIAESMLQENEFKVYPNPMVEKGTIDMNINTPDRLIIRVFDISGKVVMNLAEVSVAKGAFSLDFSAAQLRRGVYFIRVEGNYIHAVRKLLVD